MRKLLALAFLILSLGSKSSRAAGYYNMQAFWKDTTPSQTFNPVWAGGNVTGSIAGWQYGLGASKGTGDAMFDSGSSDYTLHGVANDGNFTYALDQYRIQRFNPDGSYAGWMGKILTSPTGGDVGCSGASVNTYTPGWCQGGTATSVSSLYPQESRALAIDGSYIYFTDYYTVTRMNKVTGAYAGWVGYISGAPTGGAGGCSGATSIVTPGWCMGGTATYLSQAAGALNGVYGIAISGTNLFATDTGNYRVQRFNVDTGAALGWIGAQSSLSTGFASGGNPSKEMSTASGLQEGVFYSVLGSASVGSYLYLLDNARISRHILSSGAPTGWAGQARYSPTGGGAGCTSVSYGGTTPSWCYGGTSYLDASGYYSSFANDGSYFYYSATEWPWRYRVERVNIATGTSGGWIGTISSSPTGGVAGCSGAASQTVTPGWCYGGSPYYTQASSVAAGGFGPSGSPTKFQIGADGSYVYLIDASNYRMTRYDASNGSYAGWIGQISSAPTGGDAGCNGASGYTPGWCKGGTASSMNPFNSTTNGFTASGSYLFLTDTYRIIRVDKGTGAFTGWIGRISSAPTGGDAGCSGASGYTPGWCMGGSATSPSSGQAGFSSPQGVVVVGTQLYVADSGNYRVAKHVLSTGAFGGWIGNISTAPTGGDVGCSGASGFTPGWCLGGAHSTSQGYKGFDVPVQVSSDSSYLYVSSAGNYTTQLVKFGLDGSYVASLGSSNSFADAWQTMGAPAATTMPGGFLSGQGITANGTSIYITDASAYRVSRFNMYTGAFTGWIGAISSAPTGGDASCSGASGYTPGWCKGGTAVSANYAGFSNAVTVTNDASFLYISDYNRYKISKYNMATGALGGWIGKVNASPTGGTAGCSGAATGTITPGWCYGGYGGTGNEEGAISYARTGGLANDGTYIYFGDSTNARLSRYNMSSGAPSGWVGGTVFAKNFSDPPSGNGASSISGGLSSPQGVWADTSYVYVGDMANYRVSRFDKFTGDAAGWIGRISTAPTGGDPGCSGASGITPGWCKGGVATSSGEGAVTGYKAAVQGTNLYVTASGSIVKFNKDTGAYLGWIGRIQSAPTGGDVGCNGASGYTPGWCKGGSANSSGVGSGAINSPRLLTVDSSNLYWSYDSIYSVHKHALSNGAYGGWIGGISGSPTGGGAGCSGATGVTPAWCIGGTSNWVGGGQQGFFYVYGLASSGSYLYVASTTGDYYISRWDTSTGAFTGWIGKIQSSPTGGDAGCSGATNYTPGWCRGGTSTITGYSSDPGLSNGGGLSISGSYLYSADYSAVKRYDLGSGAFKGWIGKIQASPTGGERGCKYATVGTVTKGWCKAGSSTSGSDLGGFYLLRDLYADGTNLFTVDQTNHRLQRHTTTP